MKSNSSINFGWVLVFFICLVPVIFWLQLNSIGDLLSDNFTQKSLAIGQVAGLVGLVMYSLNLILATRIKILEDLFGGLNKVFKAHHILGSLALIFLCFHPLFLAISRATFSLKEASLLLIPNGLAPMSSLFDQTDKLHFSVVEQWAIFLGIIAFWGMVVLLIITFFVKLPYSIWLFIHKFLGVAFVFALLHVMLITSDTTASKGLKAYLLFFGFLGLGAFIYRTLLPNIFVKRYKYKVLKVSKLPEDVTQIELSPVTPGLKFRPGQFIFIRFLNADNLGKSEWHPFSISSSPKQKTLTISVKSLGDFTSSLNKISQGTIAELEGAYGKFSHTIFKNKKQIWIAGGIGITPFLSMASNLPDDDYEIDLYYSVRTKSEFIETKKLLSISKIKNSKLRIFPLATEVNKKFITASYVESKSGSLKNKDIFICGPPAMMKSLKLQFKEKGIPSKNLHTEEFSID